MAETINSLEDLGTSTVAVAANVAPLHEQKLDSLGRAYATGKRKNAVARVWIKPGKGKVVINGREFATYFARPVLQLIVKQPIVLTERSDQYDVIVTVAGGGLSGQAGAVRHGISKALTYYRARPARSSQEGWLPDPRQPCCGAQEVRPGKGPQVLPVLEALSFSCNIMERAGKPALFFCPKRSQM